jgi:hypothetical protein
MRRQGQCWGVHQCMRAFAAREMSFFRDVLLAPAVLLENFAVTTHHIIGVSRPAGVESLSAKNNLLLSAVNCVDSGCGEWPALPTTPYDVTGLETPTQEGRFVWTLECGGGVARCNSTDRLMVRGRAMSGWEQHYWWQWKGDV